MRITESLKLANLNSNVQTSASNVTTLQQELATGKQINQPSDNPAGAAQAMTLRATLGNVQQYLTNIDSANSFLKSSDSQLSSLSSLITQARQIAVAAANGGTQDPASMQAYQLQVSSIISQVTNIANSDFNGRKLFAGQQTGTSPYVDPDPTHAYHGDDGIMNATIGPGQSVATNVPGDQIFQPVFAALESLNANLTSGNSAAIAASDIASIDTASTTVNNTRATIGTRLNELTDTTTRLQNSQTTYQDQLSNIEDVDLAKVYADYQSAQNIYQASLVTTSKAMQMSLADYIH